MSATYTWDVFSSLDGFGSHDGSGDWGGYWSKQTPELLEHRLALFSASGRLVLGATTFRDFSGMLDRIDEFPDVADPWVTRMRSLPTTVVSSTLAEPLDWPDAAVVTGEAAEVVAGLKRDSSVPLVSHGSLSLNRSLLAAGLVDRIRITLYPVLTGASGTGAIFPGVADYDLELLSSMGFAGGVQELVYRPVFHPPKSA